MSLFKYLAPTTGDVKNVNICPRIYTENKDILINDLNLNSYYSNNQREANIDLINFLVNPNEKTFGLYGYAGTGKTTIMIELVVYLLKNQLIKSVALTAPTNKAVNIIKAKFRDHIANFAGVDNTQQNLSFDDMVNILMERGMKIHFMSIHKLLNYKNDFDVSGEKIFIKSNKTNLNKYELVVIDECSMIPYEIIENIFTTNNKNTKILFCGDICQLPPVNENKSIIFQNTNNNNLDNDTIIKNAILKQKINKMNFFVLTQVVRTNNSNIVNLCYNIREWIDNLVKAPTIKKYVGNGVFVYKKTNNKISTEWFNKYLEYNKNNNTSNIILAWTNRQCNEYNETIRRIIFKDKKIINKYEIGDTLILTDFYAFNDCKLYTSEQIKVTELDTIIVNTKKFSTDLPIEVKNNKIIDNKFKFHINRINNLNRDYKCWIIGVKKVSDVNLDDIDKTHKLNVIHDEHIKLLENDRALILNEIQKLRKNLEKIPEYTKTSEKYIFKQLWNEWSKNYIEPYANVSNGCSITCHKSQASTYCNVFIDADDILNNNNIDEAKRCIYTALTRASKEIHILI